MKQKGLDVNQGTMVGYIMHMAEGIGEMLSQENCDKMKNTIRYMHDMIKTNHLWINSVALMSQREFVVNCTCN